MAIEIQQEQQDSLRVLTLSGRLDTETAVDVELALQDLLGAGERQFLIDLSGIGYVSSAGLRVLLGLAKQLDGGKGSLRLCGLNPSVTQVFDVAGFSKLFAIFPDRVAATRSMPQAKAEAVPPPKFDGGLAQKVATLWGINGASASAPHPQAAELARIAAQLLGMKAALAAKAGVTKPAPSSPKVAPAPNLAAASAPAQAPVPAVGVLGKLRGLFGRKP
jgi:anti-anti-sigma factor